jgi:phage terminase small subunit
MPNNKPLTQKQEAFIKAYFDNFFNAKQAYISVYNPKNELGAEANSTRLLKNDKVRIRIDELKKLHQKKREETDIDLIITRESQLIELDEVKKLAKVQDGEGKQQLQVVLKAVEIQNKMLGYDAPTRLELTGKNGEAIKTESTIIGMIIK